MSVSWPGTIPQYFLRSSYSEEAPNNLIASSVSIGPAKVRRRTTANVWKMSGSFMMTAAELATFKSFVSSTIADGATAFLFPDQFGGSARLVRITSPYGVSPFGADWQVSLELEVLP
jgi:hypothetical protein